MVDWGWGMTPIGPPSGYAPVYLLQYLLVFANFQKSVQNAAARLVSSARRYNHILPVMHQLHWLPVRKRVEFKIFTLTGTVPS